MRTEAVYQDGVFRPLTPVTLQENQRVSLEIKTVEQEEALAWLEKVSESRRRFAAEHGLLPDSTLDIAADRMR
ncbi:MAG: antitoxin family protein [Planctomycetes bacterium]|nr:antitoxin family protein [Planctomycetota bacterium]MBU4398190.1 antitoxin family protein [Planctomycetota bacterium]MCG2685678.1 antitoxin family protein [Planctomycetales bacterium]